MTGVPAPTLYHRWLGWHAPAMRRAITVLIAGLIVAAILLPFITWQLALAGVQIRAGPQTCRWRRPAIAAGAPADEPGGVTEHPPSRHVDAGERSWA